MNTKYLFLSLLSLLAFSNSQAQKFEWARSFGNTSADYVTDMKADNQGNTYTVGYYSGTVDFDPGNGVQNLTSNGSTDTYIQKLDSNGNLVWARSVGGNSDDRAFSVDIDANGNVYLTGFFRDSVDFDPGPNTDFLVGPIISGIPLRKIFVLKLNSIGNYVWARAFGGGSSMFESSIDTQGNIVTAGTYQGSYDFDPGSSVFNLPAGSGNQIRVFIQKMDASGNFVWAKSIGNPMRTSTKLFKAMDTDLNDNILLTGIFYDSLNTDPGVGVNFLYANGASDAYVLKLDKDGDYVWSVAYGGPGPNATYSDLEDPLDITVDNNGDVISVGEFEFTVDFNPSSSSTQNLTAAGSQGLPDAYVQKLDSNGNFIWAIHMGNGGG